MSSCIDFLDSQVTEKNPLPKDLQPILLLLCSIFLSASISDFLGGFFFHTRRKKRRWIRYENLKRGALLALLMLGNGRNFKEDEELTVMKCFVQLENTGTKFNPIHE